MKTYTLELTARELAGIDLTDYGDGDDIDIKLRELAKRAKADCDKESLWTPWRATQPPGGDWYIRRNNGHSDRVCDETGGRVARLMAAAPELLEAVKAWRVWWDANGFANTDWYRNVETLHDRALRKVESGEAQP